MSRKLTNKDFCNAAKQLRCGVANIKAVAEVESLQNGFLRSGKPIILFERHIFSRYTKGKFNSKYPNIANRRTGGYGKSGEHQWRRFSQAYKLDPVAAMMACSWGKFQVMGFNYAVAGYRDIHSFVDAMKRDEGEHLKAFVNFVISNRIDDELRAGQWAKFAYRYNGSGYRKNRYDEKMARAYRKYRRENIDCKAILATEQIPEFDPNIQSLAPATTEPARPSAQAPAKNTQDTADTPAEQDTQAASISDSLPTLDSVGEKLSQFEQITGQVRSAGGQLGGMSKSSWVMTVFGAFIGMMQGAWAYMQQNPLVAVALILGMVITVAVVFNYTTKSKERDVQRKGIARDVIAGA
jgi:hypothetical protein